MIFAGFRGFFFRKKSGKQADAQADGNADRKIHARSVFSTISK